MTNVRNGESSTSDPQKGPRESASYASGDSEQPVSGASEVRLIDVVLVLVRHSRLLFAILIGVTLIGSTYAITAPNEYRSTGVVLRESPDQGAPALSGGLSSLSGLGLNFGSLGKDGLGPEAYPDVLKSREVRLTIARDSFYIPEYGRPTTFVDYYKNRGGLLIFIGDIVGAITGGNADKKGADQRGRDRVIEVKASEYVGGLIGSSVNEESGLLLISATTEWPEVSATLAEKAIEHLSTRVRQVRTKKAQENYEFILERYQEAEDELYEAEDSLADFTKSNQGMSLPSLEVQRQRLQRQVQFKSELFRNLQSQKTKAELDLQKQSPVLTVVDPPAVPIRPSAPSRLLIVFLSVFSGLGLGIGAALTANFFESSVEQGADRQKVEEIKTSLERIPIIGPKLFSD
jgi:uncharacterized protein involved in exopolysaccharide biosynthesis